MSKPFPAAVSPTRKRQPRTTVCKPVAGGCVRNLGRCRGSWSAYREGGGVYGALPSVFLSHSHFPGVSKMDEPTTTTAAPAKARKPKTKEAKRRKRLNYRRNVKARLALAKEAAANT